MSKPKSYILGNVKLTKWVNENGIVSFTMEKSYKDKDDEWQTTKSFGVNELVKLQTLITKVTQEEVKEI